VPPSTGAADDGDAEAAATAAAGQQGLQYLAALPPGMAPASNRSATHRLTGRCLRKLLVHILHAVTAHCGSTSFMCCRPAPTTDGTSGAAADGEELSEQELRLRMAFASGWTSDFAERRAVQIAYNSVFIR